MTTPDRTYLAVRLQLQGMSATAYEVGVRDRATGKMLPRVWQAQEVLKAVPWLKQRNQAGCDIYIRPQGSQGLILIDDLTQGAVAAMKSDGLSPAALIETSPFNFQSWVRVSVEPIAQDLATQIAKLTAQRYDGDLNSADWRHFGRLAGFTNRKPEYQGSNGYPYVKAHACNGKIAANAKNLLTEARNTLSTTKPCKTQNPPPDSLLNDEIEDGKYLELIALYRRLFAGLARKYGDALDESRADWMVAKRMAILGYSPHAIQQAMRVASAHLEDRKQGHIEDYVERTVRNVMQDPDVTEARQQGFLGLG